MADERLKGNISLVKHLGINCKTCSDNPYDCDSPEYCQANSFCFWNPRNSFTPFFCAECKMYAVLGCYTNTNDEDFPSIKCTRHAEPCFRNYLYYPNTEKIYYTRNEKGNVVVKELRT